MKPKKILLIVFFCVCTVSLMTAGVSCTSETEVSGDIRDGYRILDIRPETGIQRFTVYRGDYIKFNLPDNITQPVVTFPALQESHPLTHDLASTPYFKMKDPGILSFDIGDFKGQINVIEYQEERYKELSALEANDFIKTQHPVIIDVRTRGEYGNGHIKDSTLIPVQELQNRIGELIKYKDDAVLIYCATGNRSTVASKILIDAGFKKVFNLKKGIADWAKNKYPVVR